MKKNQKLKLQQIAYIVRQRAEEYRHTDARLPAHLRSSRLGTHVAYLAVSEMLDDLLGIEDTPPDRIRQ